MSGVSFLNAITLERLVLYCLEFPTLAQYHPPRQTNLILQTLESWPQSLPMDGDVQSGLVLARS